MAGAALARRGLRPVGELAKDRPHGDRLRYMAGCRCQECRRANTAYESCRALARKAGDWNGIVPTDAARAHMALLSRHSVGRRVVCDVARVADSILTEIISGRKRRIRARTERAILAVTPQAAADGAYIDATQTWALLDELIADGYTRTELAAALGSTAQTPALQLSRSQVTVRNAFDVERLYARLRTCAAGETLDLLQDLSDEGFHRDKVAKLLRELAAKQGVDAPDLPALGTRTPRCIRESTASLVRQLHAQITE